MGYHNIVTRWIPEGLEYINPHQVNILVYEKRVYVDAFFPGHDSTNVFSVYLTNKFRSDKEFLNALNIRSKWQLDCVDFIQLFKLYEAGVMRIGCDMEKGCLTFHRTGAETDIYDEEMNERITVSKLFTTAQEVLDYTFVYFDRTDSVLE